MRKLKLDLGRLTVDSFATGRSADLARGTVEGHMRPTNQTLCCPQSYQCPTPTCPSVDPNTC